MGFTPLALSSSPAPSPSPPPAIFTLDVHQRLTPEIVAINNFKIRDSDSGPNSTLLKGTWCDSWKAFPKEFSVTFKAILQGERKDTVRYLCAPSPGTPGMDELELLLEYDCNTHLVTGFLIWPVEIDRHISPA